VFEFHFMCGPDIRALIAESRPAVVETVHRTYLAHHAGRTVNPNSYFLRFPDNPSATLAAPAFFAETERWDSGTDHTGREGD
jgi:N-[(2S)-2-amino-2-carboxyethyl]-L-glutamate dehydrogenase